MKCTATQLRKELFTALDKAATGEPLEVTHKGTTFRIVPEQSGSKLSRMKKRDLFLVDPASIVESDPELLAEMEAEWEEDWKDI
ncbi:MAG TPA: type II toxin-antitoxin system prevent-host-death family antitoxin [Acidobacteriaceae bacterium]|nr:type II toxin-antitoxin system prevent-host-death family antitoxin [Acidobacteriaceae bacterium]